LAAVSVLIVSWNSRAVLPRCLDSLQREPVETIVVDNASDDGSAEYVAQAWPAARLVAWPSNLGFAGGVNLAASQATGEFLLLLNPDATTTPGAIPRLVRFLEDHPEAGAAAGQLVDFVERPQRGWNVRRLPTLGSFAVDLLLLDKLWPGNPVSRRYLALDLDSSVPGPVEQPAAACLMLRRAAFDAVGGMDPGFYPAWFEDVDLCRRLLDAGWPIYFVPNAVFRHEGGVAARALGPEAFTVIWYRSMRRYVAKHLPGWRAVTVRALLVAGMLERMAVAAVRGRRPAFRAYARVLVETLTGRAAGVHPST
jgi:N-acetylglucosaminyl-diphospho-decaprenol L-rhamnosyltransferase